MDSSIANWTYTKRALYSVTMRTPRLIKPSDTFARDKESSALAHRRDDVVLDGHEATGGSA